MLEIHIGCLEYLSLQKFKYLSCLAFCEVDQFTIVVALLLVVCTVFNLFILYKYTPLYNLFKGKNEVIGNSSVSIITANVYQYNSDYHRFIATVKEIQPDLVFTGESNNDWEKSLCELENDYPETYKLPQENTYGMHLYSKLQIKKAQAHYFVADDIPSMEVDLIDREGRSFTFFGVHPPPPSPSEETTSNERDGELVSIAKRIAESHENYIVLGDFNTVAWSRVTRLFIKTSQLSDARIGRGLLSTFHADYWFFRFPIDLIFHSAAIHVQKLKVLKHIGSDHLPLLCKFALDERNEESKKIEDHLDNQELEDVETMIDKGNETIGDRDLST